VGPAPRSRSAAAKRRALNMQLAGSGMYIVPVSSASDQVKALRQQASGILVISASHEGVYEWQLETAGSSRPARRVIRQ